MSVSRNPASWLEVINTYNADLKSSYYEGSLLPKWRKDYAGSFLFCKEYMDKSLQIPPHMRRGFNELFVGTKYLDAGYDALLWCRRGECKTCFQKAGELLGDRAAEQFLTTEEGGRPPDLLVFDTPTGRFRFVECKGKESFTHRQVPKFTEIENYLNHISRARAELLTDSRDEKLFPALSPSQWIHIARVLPEKKIVVRPRKPDAWIPVAGPGQVVIGRLVLKREMLIDELKRFEAGEELPRPKMSWWISHVNEVRILLAVSPE